MLDMYLDYPNLWAPTKWKMMCRGVNIIIGVIGGIMPTTFEVVAGL